MCTRALLLIPQQSSTTICDLSVALYDKQQPRVLYLSLCFTSGAKLLNNINAPVIEQLFLSHLDRLNCVQHLQTWVEWMVLSHGSDGLEKRCLGHVMVFVEHRCSVCITSVYLSFLSVCFSVCLKLTTVNTYHCQRQHEEFYLTSFTLRPITC